MSKTIKLPKRLDQHNYFGIDATIIADSINAHTRNRITTFVVTFPRIVLAEFNTHRVLSRNSASSRAVPFEKMLKRVEEHPFIPIKWMKDHKGMQGNDYFEDAECQGLYNSWLGARDAAVQYATSLSGQGLTKQIVNRLLEPFMWHTAIVTATEWENFFALRAHEAAEIHIADLAYKMLAEYNKSTPKALAPGQWHIPFGDDLDWDRVEDAGLVNDTPDFMAVKIATARCARVSYLNFEGKDDYAADLTLHDRLASMGHWSPFEHCANAMLSPNFSGNFEGWQQYRKMFDSENKSDTRVEEK